MEELETIKPEMLVRYLAGESSSDEKAKVEIWRQKATGNEEVFQEYRQIWDSGFQSLLPADIKAADWEKIRHRINFRQENHRIGFWRTFSRAAAIFILMLAVSSALYTYWNVPGFGRWTAFQTGNYVDSLKLPDNSVVFLNNHSSLKYLRNFNQGNRTVSLKGEGFFDVTRDPSNPFLVKSTQGIDVEVLGTSFNLDVSEKRENVGLNVTDGVVSLKYKGASQRVEAGYSAMLEDHNFLIVPTVDDNYLSWKTGELIFSQSSLGSIVETLHEHYDELDIVRLEGQSNVLVTTTFKDQSLSEVLEELEIHFDKKFHFNEGVLTISD